MMYKNMSIRIKRKREALGSKVSVLVCGFMCKNNAQLNTLNNDI